MTAFVAIALVVTLAALSFLVGWELRGMFDG